VPNIPIGLRAAHRSDQKEAVRSIRGDEYSPIGLRQIKKKTHFQPACRTCVPISATGHPACHLISHPDGHPDGHLIGDLIGEFMSDLTGEELASMVTHELRNPLNAIAGWLHLLGNASSATAGPALATRAAAGLRRAVDEQLEQVETLGRVLRLAGGEPDEGARSIDLADLLQSQVDMLRAAPQAEGHAVVLELGENPGAAPPSVVVGNADGLARAVTDMSRYAMRNGVAGQPLRISLCSDADALQIEFSIDAGVDRSVSIWNLFRPPANRLPMPLLHARLAIESAGGVLLPVSGPDAIGDVLRIRFPATPQGAS
jgi:hypothetical protein